MKLITISALAELCEVPFIEVYHWVMSGQIPSVKMGKIRMVYQPNEPLPAPTPRRELRLLCMLDTGRNGKTRSLPVHTLQRLQTPWSAVPRQWSLVLPDGLQMRETHAQQPTAEVLERYLRLGQAGSLRPAVGCHQ